MKKLMTMILAPMMALSMIACTAENNDVTPSEEPVVVIEETEEDNMTGGWTTVQETELTKEEEEIFNKALDGLVGVSYEPLRVLATQLVAGTNYAFLTRATVVYPDAVPSYCIVYIYADLEGNAQIERIQDFIETEGDNIEGGWFVTGEEDEEYATAALDKALEGMTGANYEVTAVLGSQVVAGTNYLLLCMSTPVVPDAEGTYCLVTVYEDLDGNAEITEIEDLSYSLQEEVTE